MNYTKQKLMLEKYFIRYHTKHKTLTRYRYYDNLIEIETILKIKKKRKHKKGYI